MIKMQWKDKTRKCNNLSQKYILYRIFVEKENTLLLDLFFSKCLRTLSITMWYIRMTNRDTTCHKNHRSINFIYEVLGKSALIEFRKVAMTRTAVADPINLSLKPASFGSINRVVYPKSQSISDGTKAMVIWFVYKRTKLILTIFDVDSFVFLTSFAIFLMRFNALF